MVEVHVESTCLSDHLHPLAQDFLGTIECGLHGRDGSVMREEQTGWAGLAHALHGGEGEIEVEVRRRRSRP